MKSCLSAQIRFLFFKGPGSLKKIFKIGGNVEEYNAYRLIPLIPPLPCHQTVPLTLTLDVKRKANLLFLAIRNLTVHPSNIVVFLHFFTFDCNVFIDSIAHISILTLEIVLQGFSYDGEGPDAFFLAGTSGTRPSTKGKS
jgi:hypothetical protein